MKTLFAATAVICIGCGTFPTSYYKIENDKVRLLDFIYEPPEAAPGDTVLCRAIFAGKPVSSQELTWRMSKKTIVSVYGVVTALDTVPLEIRPSECTFSDRTSCIAFTFVIPDDIIEQSPMIVENWIEEIPEYYRKEIPPILAEKSGKELLALLDKASRLPEMAIDEDIAGLLPFLLQYCTVPMQIYCTIQGDHKIKSSYSVRYNNRFAKILPDADIPVNRNPRIDSMHVYVVSKSGLIEFNPFGKKEKFERIRITDGEAVTVAVNDDKSYFIAVFTSDLDSTLSIDAAMGNSVALPEQFYSHWYLEFDEEESEEVDFSKLADIGGETISDCAYVAKLYPPKDKAITHCTAWVEVDDQFINEPFRPIGSTLAEVRLNFTY